MGCTTLNPQIFEVDDGEPYDEDHGQFVSVLLL